MKCVITGGAGFIGSHLVEFLLDAGHEVSVLDIRKPNSDVHWINYDIRDDLEGVFNDYEIVYHLAALANARKASEYPIDAHTINIIGTLNVIRAAYKANVQRLLLASTSWVAGSQVNPIVDESTPFNLPDVNTIYGETKLSQEMIIYSHVSEYGGPDYTILRYGIPYGERMWKGLVVRAFMDMAERHGRLNIMGDGKQYRDFLYVGDLVEAQVMALNPIARNKIYYLTGNMPVTVETIAREVVKHFPAKIEYISQARIEPKLKRIKNDLVKSELGWVPHTFLEEGIKKCVSWWLGLSEEEKDEEYWI